ncbi:phage major capsid protein [Mammaliicoccus sciuri]|uniref:phage major capsid protein n=1 Tax=Mammaliicoccus sciuri TaxID=1296 RepID=UPI001E3A51C0|nr:phage major capsid protein [Mammaliicoccus sciuri]MCD8777399.1 phage major capsid protein [Mammaliicoccus sciuri]MCD8780785.1 phage major capsid protein [Mammaliicoccus sciuri]MEB6057317.1 phage major capsid protein [Mammaliicoccus sciuri]
MNKKQLLEALKNLRTQRDAKRKEALKYVESDLKKAKELRDEVKSFDEQIAEKEEDLQLLEDLEGDKSKDDPNNKKQSEDGEGEEGNPSNDDGENEQRSHKRNNPKVSKDNVVTKNKASDAVENFRKYLITQNTRSVKTTDEGVLVPEEISTKIEDFTDELEALDKLVDVRNVKTPIGKFPVRTDETKKAGLPTVQELEESPELGLRKLGEQKYEINTHRGLLKVSWEALDDGVEVENIIVEELAEEITATKNGKILNALKDLTPKTVTTIGEIKTILNVELKKRYAKEFVVSTDVYDQLDQMKDKNGRYLLQESITSATGYRMFGKDVRVIDKEVIGENTMFVGSLKDAVVLFLRKQLLVNYEVWNQYGKVFSPILRLDARLKNKQAVVKVDFQVDGDYPHGKNDSTVDNSNDNTEENTPEA